jgi:sulfur-oxidizing protein SoxY
MLGAVGNESPVRSGAQASSASGGGVGSGGAVLYKKAEIERSKVRSGKLNRRQFAAGVAASIGAGALPVALAAQDAPQGWEQAVKKVLGEAKPIEGKQLTLDLPEIAENGNTVPFTVSVESPMSETDHVKVIHILATANPQPGVAVFRFSPLSGKAAVASRMRLARTQDVISIAELSDGRFLMTKRNVKVTIGGCGG